MIAEDDHVMKCNAKDFVLKLWSLESNGSPSDHALAKVCFILYNFVRLCFVCEKIVYGAITVGVFRVR